MIEIQAHDAAARDLLDARAMDDTSTPKAVIYRVKPTVVRRRFAIDPKTSSAMDEPPPSSIYPHPDYNLPEDDELRGE